MDGYGEREGGLGGEERWEVGGGEGGGRKKEG